MIVFPLILSGFLNTSPACWFANLLANCSFSFCSSLTCCCNCSAFETTSFNWGDLTIVATCFSCFSSSSSSSYASLLVTASIRRTPAPIPDSETILKIPMFSVFATCVPPHSSIDQPPILTTRTSCPYFSPNKAIAPIFLLTILSISANSSEVIWPKWVKSNRKCPGATKEPAWFACSPSTSFNALCSRWVAVWFLMIRLRIDWSINRW